MREMAWHRSGAVISGQYNTNGTNDGQPSWTNDPRRNKKPPGIVEVSPDQPHLPACLYACLYACLHTCLYTCPHTCLYTAHIYTHIFTHVYTHACAQHTSTHMSTHMPMHISHQRTCPHTRLHTCLYATRRGRTILGRKQQSPRIIERS